MEESIGFLKIFDTLFLMNLHGLECPENDLTISGKCLLMCEKKKSTVMQGIRK